MSNNWKPLWARIKTFLIGPRLHFHPSTFQEDSKLFPPLQDVQETIFYSGSPATVKRGGEGKVRPLHRPRSAIPRTSWNGSTKKLQTKEDHYPAAFFAPGIMVQFFSLNYEYQGFKIRFSDLQNSLFRRSKFAFKIRVPDLQNSRFKASKFALQGLTHEPKKSIEIRGRELNYCLK